MKLFERLPDTVEIDGRKYRLDLDFRNVLRMIEIMSREDLLSEARNYLALKCVMRKVPKNVGKAMTEVSAIIFPKTDKKADKGPKLTDYAQDADLIRAAFLQCYGINLWREKLHWFEFTGLLAGLPDGSRYIDIVGIRAKPLPEPTKYNAKERQWLIEAKQRYAIKKTAKEEEEARLASFHATTLSLLALAKRGGDLNAKGY